MSAWSSGNVTGTLDGSKLAKGWLEAVDLVAVCGMQAAIVFYDIYI
jgi:hypothetical protein